MFGLNRLIHTAVLIFLLQNYALPFFSGNSFDDRKQAYINDQGAKWSNDFPYSMIKPVYGWLETPDINNNRSRISEEIGYLTIDCASNFGNWENCWFTGDHPTAIAASRILHQYKNVITTADADKIKTQMYGVASSSGVWCGVANFQIRYLVAAYLYVALGAGKLGANYDNMIDYPLPDPTYNCPPPFCANGNCYEGGKKYDAVKIFRDYLYNTLDDFLKSGTEEDLSPSEYYSAQLHSMALLSDVSPDAGLRNRAKLILDWLLFHYAVGVSANHLAGGHGRHYVGTESDQGDNFPLTIYYGMDASHVPVFQRQLTTTEYYVSAYRHPSLMTDIVESMILPGKEGNDFYRLIRGHSPLIGKYRYDYLTPNYNLGGTGLGTGWELNIKNKYNGRFGRLYTTPIKLWINGCPDDFSTCNTANPGWCTNAYWRCYILTQLGANGSQHRNALFYSGGGYLHIIGLDTNYDQWEKDETSTGWRFLLKNGVAVAVQLTATASALEVATIGVDYLSYIDFKNAILGNTALDDNGFTTSKGFRITKGYIDYGADFTKLPFDRLDVWEGHTDKNDETKIVDWNNSVMKITKNGQELIHNFIDWTNSAPAGISGKPSPHKLAAQMECAPNPFHAKLSIRYHLRPGMEAQVKIYDLRGRTIKSFSPDASLSHSTMQRIWDGRDMEDRVVPAGIYWIGVEERDVLSSLKKIIYLK